MENRYLPSVKYGHLQTALDDLAIEDLQELYREACSWDGSFEECCLYDLDELVDLITWDSDTIREFIKIGEADYYYSDCYGWQGIDYGCVHDRLSYYSDVLAEWLTDCLTLEYNFDESCFEVTIDYKAPWSFENDEELIKAALCDLAYRQGFISLARDEEKLEELYRQL